MEKTTNKTTKLPKSYNGYIEGLNFLGIIAFLKYFVKKIDKILT